MSDTERDNTPEDTEHPHPFRAPFGAALTPFNRPTEFMRELRLLTPFESSPDILAVVFQELMRPPA